ncbi:hypothetical protein INS49_009797 [Diaporthe citri]|uniref:uncharacterized protein n=1 Tax=Diaporthe citri TaxID=83186 RepID=UPI001C815469|nr:uncharacterized protein INS49_009797 [Diaporthe citri]KAG6361570.1 hypothetical protein INS49_009797 [Diaporthe citri]
MAASNSNNAQRSGRFIESLQNTAPQVVPSSKSGNEDEESRKKRLARQHLQKAREALPHTLDSAPKHDTPEDVETSDSVDSDVSVSDDEPVHLVAELAAVSTHEDLDHPMPDYDPGLDSADTGVPEGLESDDVIMEDAPPLHESELDSADTIVPEGLESDDVVMEDAPPLDEGEE